MSFEGYWQKICRNGHYFTTDVYVDDEDCRYCGAQTIWRNIVDQTNGEEEGYIDLKPITVIKCKHCKNVLEKKYQPPEKS